MGRKKKQDSLWASDFNCSQQVPSELYEQLGFLLGQNACFIRCATQDNLSRLALTQRHLRILELIDWQHELSQHQIGEKLNIDRTTMVNLIDEMEANSWLQRERHPKDRRAHIIVITPFGHQILAEARETLNQVETEYCASLSAEEAQQLKTLLKKLHQTYLGQSCQETVPTKLNSVSSKA